MMTKFKKDLKKIVLVVFGCMLLLNAGFDFLRWNVRHRAEKAAAEELKKDAQFAVVTVHQCFLVADVGWLCDVELTLVDGRKGRLLHVYSPDAE
jgi:hypothetical protein